MDPLSLLRSFAINNDLDQVVERENTINFGGRFSFEKTALTAYKSDQGKGDFYDLESVVFFLKRSHLSFGDYRQAAKEHKVTQVKLIDLKDLEGYLTGKRETSNYVHLEAVPALDSQAAPAKKARIEGNDTAAAAAPKDIENNQLLQILASERQLRDRNSMLSVPGRSFHRVLEVLDVITAQEAQIAAEKQRKEEERKAELEAKQKATGAVGPQPSGRYQRETAPEAGLQQIGAQNLGLQQVGFAAGPAGAAAGVPPPPPPQQQQQRSAPPPPPPSSSAALAAAAKSAADGKQQNKKLEKPINPTPIIMVPPAAGAILNMINVRDFLENGQFETVEQATAAGKSAPAQGYHSFLRTIGRRPPGSKYHITDREPKDEKDWQRVVAVFCLGKPWQFKRFPFAGAATGDLVDTFQNVCGVYLQYSDEPLDPQVKKWNVKVLKISRHSRDADADVAREFWTHLDNYMKSHHKKASKLRL